MLPFTPAGFEIQHIASRENLLTITAHSVTSSGICPSCGEASAHVHRYYQRHPQDLPISGYQVQLILQVRRFRCCNARCARHTFAERLPEVPISARHTNRLGTILDSIAVVLSGQAGSRLALAMSDASECRYACCGVPQRRSRCRPRPAFWEWMISQIARGHTYGTILLN